MRNISFLILILLAGQTLLAQDQEIVQDILQLASTARRITANTVPAIKKIVVEADNLLQRAVAGQDGSVVRLAEKLYGKAIRLGRQEHTLRRKLRRTVLKTQKRRQKIGSGSSRDVVNTMRQTEGLLSSIKQQNAFRELRHNFIRRTLNLVNQRLRQLARKVSKAAKADADAEVAVEPRKPARTKKSISFKEKAGRAIEKNERLRGRRISSISDNRLAQALVIRADKLLGQARSRFSASDYQKSLQKARIAERLYKRAFAMGT